MEDSTPKAESATPEEFAEAALAYAASLRMAPGQYAESPGLRPSLVGTALATAALHIPGALGREGSAAEREALAKTLHEKQSPETGAYVDLTRDTPSARRFNLPLFGWAIRALAMLGEKPERPVKPLRRWDDPDELVWWLGLLGWQRSARVESLRAMNVGIPRVLALKRGKSGLKSSVTALFAWLRSRQDKASGFWGPARGGDISEGLGATFHVAKMYEAAGHPPPNAERIARTVLDICGEGLAGDEPWECMAGLCLLLAVLPAGSPLAGEAAESARAHAAGIAGPARSRSWSGRFASLSDAVLRLEALRAAALLSADDAWSAAREWRSAWDPSLWYCEW